MDSIDQLIGYVMPYMPIKLEEKQDLLETVSVRERYLTFLEILVKQKENINFQMEMAKKLPIRLPNRTVKPCCVSSLR